MAEYIERDAATKLLRKIGLEANEKFGLDFASGIFDAMRFLKEQPAADVAPVVHGRWVHDGVLTYGGQDWYHCSECYQQETGVYAKRQYCSMCGAKMDLEG